MYPGERFKGYSHQAGLIFALAGAVWLLAKVSLGEVHRLIGALIIFLSVIALYAASPLYHSSRGSTNLATGGDHCPIYVLIAGGRDALCVERGP